MVAIAEYQSALKTQIRVISALVLRETRVTYGTTTLGYFWAVAEPVFGTLMLVFVFSFISQTPPLGTSFALFFATGLLLFQTWKKLSSTLMGVFRANRGLLTYPLVKTMDTAYARMILVSMTSILVLVLFFTPLVMFTNADPPQNLIVSITAFFAVILLGTANGLLNAVLSGLWPTWIQVEAIISRPMFFISGIFFLPSNFPPDVQYWLSWNPILHCIEWFREGYYGFYKSPLLDKGYLGFFIAILCLLALLGERVYRKRIT